LSRACTPVNQPVQQLHQKSSGKDYQNNRREDLGQRFTQIA